MSTFLRRTENKKYRKTAINKILCCTYCYLNVDGIKPRMLHAYQTDFSSVWLEPQPLLRLVSRDITFENVSL